MNVNNRWFQLVASLIAMVMIANLQYAWTLFVNPLRDGTGWSLTDIQLAFTLFIFCQTWVQPIDGFLIDRLSAMMMTVVTFVSFCVHVYTIGYMKEDPGYQRFFSYISLFTFSMREMNGMNSDVPPPNPAAMIPAASPRRSLNHLSAEPIEPL